MGLTFSRNDKTTSPPLPRLPVTKQNARITVETHIVDRDTFSNRAHMTTSGLIHSLVVVFESQQKLVVREHGYLVLLTIRLRQNWFFPVQSRRNSEDDMKNIFNTRHGSHYWNVKFQEFPLDVTKKQNRNITLKEKNVLIKLLMENVLGTMSTTT